MRHALLCLLAMLLAASFAPAASSPVEPLSGEPRSWELRQGRWQRAEEPATRPAPEPTLDRVSELILARQYSAARKLAVGWLKSHKESPVRDRGLYLLGQANYHYGDRIRAFYNFDELMDRHPGSPYFGEALQRQYDIAEGYLRGYKRRFLGVPMFEARDEAVEMLYRIQQRAPGSPLADRAMLRTADYYYASSQFDLAADAYAAYARSYPRNPLIPKVRLRQAYSSLAQFRGVKWDATPMIDARQQLLDLIEQHPDLARKENLPSLVSRIDQTVARKLYETADFYRRTRKPGAAAYYYRYITANFPTAHEAGLAQRQLERLGHSKRLSPPVAPPATAPAMTATNPEAP